MAASVADLAKAWARFEASAARPFDRRLAGHLFRRAAFGASWAQLERALADGPQKTIDRLLQPAEDAAAFEQRMSEWETPTSRSADSGPLAAWWLRRMIETPQPLLERMTLFWHYHFAVSAARVESAVFVQRYLKLLRTHALGRFDQLLAAVVRDPATLVSLGAAANRRSAPSKHFAATLLGPYTLGDGVATKEDVLGAARAFTGQFVQHDETRFVEREHDTGVKRVLGQEGPLKSDDVVRIVLRQPALAPRLVRKLYRWLISETHEPSDELLAPLVEDLRAKFDVGRLVETMLRSNHFFDPRIAYRQRLKSPVEFAVGLIRAFEGLTPTAPLAQQLAAQGQDLLNPPTIHGWEGGRAWITRATLIARGNLARSLLYGGPPFGDGLQPEALSKKHGRREPRAASQFLMDLLLQGDVGAQVVAALSQHSDDGQQADNLRAVADGITALPEYQLS